MSKKIKFAVVGAGHIGKRHAEMITRNSECEVVALIDCKPRESLGIDKYDVPFYSALEDFLTSEVECDVVNIATPNGFHAKHALILTYITTQAQAISTVIVALETPLLISH